MTTPTGGDAFMQELEINVRAELTEVETGRVEEVVAEPIGEWLSDPVDDERYEVDLRDLLSAVEAIEDDS